MVLDASRPRKVHARRPHGRMRREVPVTASPLALGLLALFASQAPGADEVAAPSPVVERAPSPSVQLRVDLAADEQYAVCVRLLRQGQDVEGRACLDRLVEVQPDTTAALRAESVLSALPPRPAVVGEVLPRRAIPFEPGHLELALTSGLFGAYNGAVGAVWLATNPQVAPLYVSAAGGAAAVALGGVYGLGSWWTADALRLSAGDARLLASGIGFGAGLGLTLAPWMFSLAGVPWPDGALPPFRHDLEQALPLALLPSLVGGYLGLGGAAALAALLDLEDAQVATLNTGGGTGLLLGLAATPFLSLLGLEDPLYSGLLYLGSTSLGLLSGFGVAHLLRLDLWELVVIDVATVSAFALVGGGAFLLRSGGPPSPALDVVAGGATALGTLTGLVGSTAAVAFFRVRRGEVASRAGLLPLEVLFAPPTAVLDTEQQLVPLFSLVAVRF